MTETQAWVLIIEVGILAIPAAIGLITAVLRAGNK